MDAATLQSKVYSGYAKAALRMGLPFDVYRSAGLLTPIAIGNKVHTGLLASFTTGMQYSAYNKPTKPDWIGILDGSQVQLGDWLVGVNDTFWIADMQPLLPIAAAQANRTVSIMRPSYTTTAPMEAQETAIATALPVFMQTKRDVGSAPPDFPTRTNSEAAVPKWTTWINAHAVGQILKNDVMVDENGERYVIDSPDLTSFGYICLSHIEKP
ncbi:MAG: hypothetical protein B7Z62_02070 [Deltaproteobacteria bacterium 37-65-8]|nr:MAG: hypothetical protein B7Z62_02070 [Deltaproteobacteria bacterium 37-65-8]